MAPEMALEIPEGAVAHAAMRGAGDEVGENVRKAHASPRSDGSTTRQKTVSRSREVSPDMRSA